MNDEATDEMHVAYHEAGHAVICKALGYDFAAVVLTDANHGQILDPPRITDERDFCIVRWAGPESELQFFGSVLQGGSANDLIQVAKRNLKQKLQEQYHETMVYLVKKRRDQIEAIGQALLSRRRLDESAVDSLMSH